MCLVEELNRIDTEGIRRLFEDYFLEPKDGWEELKGMKFEELKEKLDKQSFNQIYMLALDDYYCRDF